MYDNSVEADSHTGSTPESMMIVAHKRVSKLNRNYREKAVFSNSFNLFASNSCSRRFFVIAMAR